MNIRVVGLKIVRKNIAASSCQGREQMEGGAAKVAGVGPGKGQCPLNRIFSCLKVVYFY